MICRGHLDVYAQRGSYQLIIEDIVPRGMGALELALRQLREKLAREGLFDPARKRPLPPLVRRIAVVTSPTGAAIRDFLQVLGRRWRGADVLVVPVRVQGEGAAAEIAAAIETVNRLNERLRLPLPDRLPGRHPRRRQHGRPLGVQRGAGGPGDRRLADSGDFRRRARDRRDAFRPGRRRAGADAQRGGRTGGAGGRRVGRPVAAGRAAAGGRRCVGGRNRPGRGWTPSPATRPFAAPTSAIFELARRLDELDARRCGPCADGCASARQQIDTVAGRLESLSPLAVLGRGYSLTQRTADGRMIRAAAELSPGEQITTRFARGQAISRVERVERVHDDACSKT